MAGNNTQRYTAALKYINDNVSRQLALSIVMRNLNQEAVGLSLSLSGGGFSLSGSNTQHVALRALLLCQRAFFTEPGCVLAGVVGEYNGRAKLFFKGKPEARIVDSIRAYERIAPLGTQALADVAADGRGTAGNFELSTTCRADDVLGANVVCFNAVKLWLFKAGFVSMRWMLAGGFDLNANTCNAILGQGQVIIGNEPQPLTLAQAGAVLNQMPRGSMFNFHDPKSPAVCHWGVCLGNGMASGSNTQENWDGALHTVGFEVGNSVCGRFPLIDSYDVCTHKYGTAGERSQIMVRQIDPSQNMTFI